MALERKPVKSQPQYPDLEQYAQERRQFLLKLGAVAAGFMTLAGCNDAKTAPANPAADAAGGVRPVASQPVAAQPVATPQASIRGEAAIVQPAQPVAPQAQAPGRVAAAKRSELYTIDGKDVPKDKFETFLKSLKQTSNAFCERTIYGGNTGYDAEDASGIQYTYRQEMLELETQYSITKKSQ